MTASFTPERSDAIRDLLVERVAVPPPRHRRRALVLTLLVAAGALGGAGVSTAAFAATGVFAPDGAPVASGEAVPAPPGTTPGAPLISTLDEPVSQSVADDTTISLDDRPAEATHLRVTVVALTAGSLGFGTDAAGNNPQMVMGPSDIGTRSAGGWYDFPLDAGTADLYLTPDGGFTGTVTLQYLTYVPTHLGVNARGETYGAAGGPDGDPDLVAVVGQAPDGAIVEGYARATDLAAFSPDHPDQPADPDEALELQEQRDADYPAGWDIPVFESDGVTRVGTFHIGS